MPISHACCEVTVTWIYIYMHFHFSIQAHHLLLYKKIKKTLVQNISNLQIFASQQKYISKKKNSCPLFIEHERNLVISLPWWPHLSVLNTTSFQFEELISKRNEENHYNNFDKHQNEAIEVWELCTNITSWNEAAKWKDEMKSWLIGVAGTGKGAENTAQKVKGPQQKIIKTRSTIF